MDVASPARAPDAVKWKVTGTPDQEFGTSLPSGAVAALANIGLVTIFVVLDGAGDGTFGSDPITLAY